MYPPPEEAWKASAVVAGYSCRNSQLTSSCDPPMEPASSAFFEWAQKSWLAGEAVEPPVLGPGGRRPPAAGHGLLVLPVAEPRDEQKLVGPLAPLGLQAQIVEQPGRAVGGAFQPHLRAAGVGHRLKDARGVFVGIGPVGDLRSMEKLDGVRPADPFRLGGADLVGTVQAAEFQLLGVRGQGLRLYRARAVGVEPLGHLEQVVGRLIPVGEDEGAETLALGRLPVEPGFDVGADPRLAGLEDKHADPAGPRVLVLGPHVNAPLHMVQVQRRDRAGFGADLQAAGRIVLEIILQALTNFLRSVVRQVVHLRALRASS